MARTLDQLAIIANQIKDATLQGENTADRVGGLLVDLIDFLRTINVDEITLSPLLTALNKSGLVDPQDGQILKFKSSEDNWVFSSDITQITSTIRTIIDTLGQLDNGFVKKTGDIMTGLLTTLAGIKVRNFLQLGDRFVSGLLGEGAIFRENVGGRTYLEADEMYIRVKAYFDTVEIRKFLHSGGNRIASVSGAKCIRVEMLNSANEIVTEYPTKYRCYFRASDGDNTVTNDFVVGDQAYCHITNATNSSLNMHHYWRLVVGKNESPTENGEHWIDLSNQESETIDGVVYSGYLNISDAPIAQDDIIQLGNVNDRTRRGAIIEFVSGNDAPSYQIFQGLGAIGTASTIEEKHNAQYSYVDKNYISLGYNSSTGRAYLNVFGDFLFGDRNETTYVKYNASTKQLDIKAVIHFTNPETQGDITLDNFASTVTGDLENLQRQIDGEIDTWFYNGTPGPTVLPESEWVAIDEETGNYTERLKHLGDLYYDNSTGYAYRYSNTGTEVAPVFVWSQISDSAVIKALENAAKAQDTADHKRRVFITAAGVLPTPPYSEGDIWVNVIYPVNASETDAENNIYYNDVLRCNVPATYNQQGELIREGVERGETALITHWQLSSKYTDDTKVNNLLNNTYVQKLIGGSINQAITDGDAAAVQQAATAANNTYGYLTQALNQDTVSYGGLVLTSLIALRDGNSNVWSGISGTYIERTTPNPEDPEEPYAKGHGIAAWYGGEQIDHEAFPALSNFAKSLFRFDGSGYLAGGNITWDSTGALTVQGQAIKGNTYYLNGVNITTTLNNILSMFTLEGEGTTENPYIIKANYSLYSVGGISALGKGEDESHEIGVLNDLNDVSLSNPTANQVLTYNGTHWVNRSIELGSQTLADLTDVVITSPAANQMLGYDATTQKWKNIAIPATGVTSVALSMPTGFSITGSPITASGTFTVTFSSGYSLPTTAKQSNWDTAYGWGDHASAGYVKSSGVTSVATGTGLTGGTITTSGTISINSTYQTYISHGESAYNWGNHANAGYAAASSLSDYLPLSGGTLTGELKFSGTASTGYTYAIEALRTMPDNAKYGFLFGHNFSAYNCGYITFYKYQTSSQSNAVIIGLYNQDNIICANGYGYVGIGTSGPLYKLHVDGDAYANNYLTSSSNGSYVQIGAIRLVYDSANNAIKVIKSDGSNASLYATGGISALGAGQESGGGNYLPLSGGTISGGNNFRPLVVGGTYSGITEIGVGNGNVVYSGFGYNNGYTFMGREDGGGYPKIAIRHSDGALVYSPDNLGSIKMYVTSSGAMYATGYNNTSDIRKKNVIKDVSLRLEQIAKAPAFEYYWLDQSIDHDLHVGTSAQYWESVLPEVVSRAKDEMGTLSMQYGVAALVSAITVARKVMTHEEEIALLKTRVSALEKENGEQEQLINSLQEELAKFKAA